MNRDCMSSQQLVNFIHEHINTVSAWLFSKWLLICHSDKMMGCLTTTTFAWGTIFRRRVYLQYVKECLTDAWLHQQSVERGAITWPWSWCNSKSQSFGTKMPKWHSDPLAAQMRLRFRELIFMPLLLPATTSLSFTVVSSLTECFMTSMVNGSWPMRILQKFRSS